MARSEEAILRRALKRERTEGEQRYADRIDMKRNSLKLKQKFGDQIGSNKRSRLSKPSVGNQKEDGSRNSSHQVNSTDNVSHRKTDSHGRRISDSSEMPNRKRSSLPRTKKANNPRHNVETSKKLNWARQSDSKTISRNQELRKRYRETGGNGMDTDDLERAKLLIARDQRKQEKKKKKEQIVDAKDSNIKPSKGSSGNNQKDESFPSKNTEAATQEQTSLQGETLKSRKKGKQSTEAQAKRDQNRALRKLFLETGGKGMKVHQIERAKLLIARDEKKRRQRVEAKTKK